MNETATTSTAVLSGAFLRSELLKLIENCPVDLCNAVECPLFPVRQLNEEERLEWLDSLDVKEMEYLACYHHVCMKLKLEAHPGETDQDFSNSGRSAIRDPQQLRQSERL